MTTGASFVDSGPNQPETSRSAPVVERSHLLVTRVHEGYAVEEPGPGSDSRPSAGSGAPASDAPAVRILADLDALAAFVADRERAAAALGVEAPRWVWESASIVPGLLERGVRVERCHDLALVGRILATAGYLRDDPAGPAVPGPSQAYATAHAPDPHPGVDALFSLDALAPERSPADTRARFEAQQDAVARADAAGERAGAMRLLASAESAGALIAAELRAAGLPFSVEAHDRILVEALGERGPGGVPGKLAAQAEVVRAALGDPHLNIDSPRDLLRALRRAGLDVASTSKWELAELDHPVIAPLMTYKRMHRLLTANGWTWSDTWVRDGRFRPEYLPGGVVTGRWATSGGGALQLPREVRGAVVADPGWKLVVADAAQVEPRILAAMSGDAAMARAGAAQDMYDGIVARGAVPDRRSAKIGMLGAMYGGTTGESAKLLPGLERSFPRAMALVEYAARAGERGEQVRTWLGRTSPEPPERFRPRDWGRFTRNFIVQGTAAEWALCWMAGLRQRLARLSTGGGRVVASPLGRDPHLVYFLHDEVVVHAPARLAEASAAAVEKAAAAAGALLFRGSPVQFPVTVAVVDRYGDAK